MPRASTSILLITGFLCLSGGGASSYVTTLPRQIRASYDERSFLEVEVKDLGPGAAEVVLGFDA